jgi:hypothetical protein
MMQIRHQAESADKPNLGALYKKHFDSVDANKDGHITSEEYTVADADWLTKADTDGDGKTSRAEWSKFREETNHVFDANEDTFTEENFGKLDKNRVFLPLWSTTRGWSRWQPISCHRGTGGELAAANCKAVCTNTGRT